MLGEEGFFGQIAEGVAGGLDLELELKWGPGTSQRDRYWRKTMALGWLVLIEGGLDEPGRQLEKCAGAVSALRLLCNLGTWDTGEQETSSSQGVCADAFPWKSHR